MHIINPYRFAAAGGGTSPGTTNLKSWWSLDETSGNRFDSHGSITLTDINTVGSATGKQGNAASFVEANNEYLINSSAAALDPSASDFTVVSWINMTNATETFYRGIISAGNVSAAQTIFMLWMNIASDSPASNLVFGCYDTTGVPDHVYHGTITGSTFIHVVCSFKVSTGEISIATNNGTPSTGTLTGTLNTGLDRVVIGATRIPDSPNNGLVDEVAIFHQLMSDDEKTWLYNNGNGRAYGDL